MSGPTLPSEDKMTSSAKANGDIPANPAYDGWVELGLSKRELFAAMIAQGLATADQNGYPPDGLARAAVARADALLKELAK